MYLFESKKNYEVYFKYKGEAKYYSSHIFRKVYTDIINWLYDNGYKFDEKVKGRELINSDEVPNNYDGRGIHNIPNTNYSIIVSWGIPQCIRYLKVMLERFGATDIHIKAEPIIKKFGEIDIDEEDSEEDLTQVEEPMQKMTLIKAAQIILQENGNKPMSTEEIWNVIQDRGLGQITSSTSWKSLYAKMIAHSKGDKPNLFTIVHTNPHKFILSNPDKVQDFSEERESSKLDIQTKGPLDANSSERKENPFRQCICILGDPGVGKSVTTIETIGNDDNHKFYLSIPTDLSTSMLVQFVRGELVLNKISKMIVEAYKNPNIKYTVLIDEFHKPLTIKRVNDELLQAISTKRYREHRFISSEIAESFISQELDELGFTEKQYSYHGNIEIPRNFGFILLSSKPNVILDNEDLYDRMDIIYLRKKDKDTINNIKDLKLRIIHKEEDKKSFKKLIKSEDKEMDEDVWRESLNNFLDNISREPIKESFSPIIKFTDWRIL